MAATKEEIMRDYNLTEEQFNQMVIAAIDDKIAKLKTEFEKLDAVDYTGTSREIKEKVAETIRARYELQQEEQRIKQRRNEIEGASEAVKDFLNQKPPTSKFDVDAGRIKLDEDIPEVSAIKGKPLFPEKTIWK